MRWSLCKTQPSILAWTDRTIVNRNATKLSRVARITHTLVIVGLKLPWTIAILTGIGQAWINKILAAYTLIPEGTLTLVAAGAGHRGACAPVQTGRVGAEVDTLLTELACMTAWTAADVFVSADCVTGAAVLTGLTGAGVYDGITVFSCIARLAWAGEILIVVYCETGAMLTAWVYTTRVVLKLTFLAIETW